MGSFRSHLAGFLHSLPFAISLLCSMLFAQDFMQRAPEAPHNALHFMTQSEVLHSQTGEVLAYLVCPENALPNTSISVLVKIDMTGMAAPDNLLGSFTASLNWDQNVLAYTGTSGILSGFTGFVGGPVGGVLVFNGAKATGVGGVIDIVYFYFDVMGSLGSTATLDMEFTAMAAAFTFANLLPFLTVNDCEIRICQPGLLGNVNGDSLVNSTDALIVLSYDIGIAIPPPFQALISLGFGDVNFDTGTNSGDALIILTSETSIPIPFPVGDPICLPSGDLPGRTPGRK